MTQRGEFWSIDGSLALATQNRTYQTDFISVYITGDSFQRLIKILNLQPSDRSIL
ncbi:MAG: hypothetical protein V7K48_30510 [Nostoc sp.]|uniref:hypothetical protein n=1 Tax=Nostoc sp. TaxID=1180 RepID=UPI002FFA994A